MARKTVLISGANTGLGFEAVKALMKSDVSYQIILGSRTVSKGEEATKKATDEISKSKSTVSVIQLDVTDDDSINSCAKKVADKFDHVDILINNAGASFDNSIKDGKMTTRQAWNASWDVNVVGAHILTEAMVPLLLNSSDPRLIFITSGTSSLQETELKDFHVNFPPAAGWPKERRALTSYRSTKTGLNMMMREWSKILANDNVKVFALAPGFLVTGLGGEAEEMRKLGAKEPWVGGESIKIVVEGSRDSDAGKVVRNYNSPIQPY